MGENITRRELLARMFGAGLALSGLGKAATYAASPQFEKLVNKALNQRSIFDEFNDPTNIKWGEIEDWHRKRLNRGIKEEVSNTLLATPQNNSSQKRIIEEVNYWNRRDGYIPNIILEERLNNYEIIISRQGQIGALADYSINYNPSVRQISYPDSGLRRKQRNKFAKDTLLNKAINYGAIDEYLNWKNISEGRLGDIAQGVLLYPIDFALDVGIRSPKAVFYDIPVEALERTKIKREMREMMIKKANNGFVRILLAPIHLAQNTIDFSVNYGIIAAEGMAEQITQRPLETAMHGLVGYMVYDALKGNNGHRHVLVAEENPPGQAFDNPLRPGGGGGPGIGGD